MLNSTIIGGREAREALAEASLRLEVDTDWCVGGCAHFADTEGGRARYLDLKTRYEAQQQEES